MPRVPLHALIWSMDRTCYELFRRGQLVQRFRPGDDQAWQRWLAAQTGFAFHGHSGRLNLHNEARTRTKRYWYAYYATEKRLLKHYLGKTANLTLERLEQVAGELSGAHGRSPRVSHSPSPASRAQMPTVMSDAVRKAEQPLLLATKLAAPRVPAALVGRERLLVQLDAALSHRLTLLSAAAGWGKTTLLASWLQSVERSAQSLEQLHDAPALRSTFYALRSAWLSLDELDNNLTRFWIALIAALRTCVPAVGDLALAMLHSPEPPPLTAMLTALLNDLASVAEAAPMVLILDDYHLINDQAIHESLTFFLEHLPENLHLVVASRVDPELPLSRWRVRGELLELRAADLRFSAAEASSFFTQALGEVLADEDVRLLEQRTEGWIAGMQLAALALRQRDDRSAFVQAFSGSQRYLMDYVQEEILQRQPLSVQRFLLQSAVLPRLNAALCAALTEERTSQAMLERLERNNLFVVPLDEQRQWYRMHDLFREALLARLQTTEPELVPVLHQRAAHWYAAHDELREAITHALAGRDFASAASLLERAAERLWLSGEIQTLYRWVMALPDEVVRAHARLVLTVALYLMNSAVPSGEAQRASVRTQAEQLMARVEAALRQPVDGAVLDETETALLQQRLGLLHDWYAVFEAQAHGDLEQMRNIWQQMQDLPLEDELRWQMIPLHVMVNLGEWLLRGDGVVSLVPLLLEAKQRAIGSGDRFATIKVMQWLALIYLCIGRLRQVQQECVAALELLQQLGGHSALAGYCRFFLSLVLFEWNELDQARSLLRQVLEDAHIWQQGELEVLGYIVLAEVEMNAGNLLVARQALEQAEQLAQHHRFARYRSWTEPIRVELWLAEGNLAAANDWAAYVASHSGTWPPTNLTFIKPIARFAYVASHSDTWPPSHYMPDVMVGALVWVYLVQQQYSQALETLERFSTYLEQQENIVITIRFLALQVLALHYSGKRKQARAVARRLLALSEAEGYIRVYLQKGELMRGLLQSLLGALHDQSDSLPPSSLAFVRKLLAAFAELKIENEELRNTISESSAPHSQFSILNSQFVAEPLTPREQEVLRQLVAGRGNPEIAEALVVSINTIKTHLQSIYRKLNVTNRTDAYATARERRLV